MKKSVNIIFLVPYPQKMAPGQRFRFEHYLGYLSLKSIRYEVLPFIRNRDYKPFFKKSGVLFKIKVIAVGYLRRFKHLFIAGKADFIFIYREAAPLGPPLIEWFLIKILKKKVIYDFDDSIWLRDPGENSLVSMLKWKSKIRKICSWCHTVTCGNDFLASYSEAYAASVKVIPTVVDTRYHSPQQRSNHAVPVIGWTGSHSTLIYLERVMPVLRRLVRSQPFVFHIIANRNPGYTDEFIRFIPWSVSDEITQLNQFDIGIMPLTDHPWSQGKCGFKLIQYGAIGIPSVADNIGVNNQVVDQGKTGFLCDNELQWYETLQSLLKNKTMRKNMGVAARKKIVLQYSVSATEKQFLHLFD